MLDGRFLRFQGVCMLLEGGFSHYSYGSIDKLPASPAPACGIQTSATVVGIEGRTPKVFVCR
jgi:hypothetical protein